MTDVDPHNKLGSFVVAGATVVSAAELVGSEVVAVVADLAEFVGFVDDEFDPPHAASPDTVKRGNDETTA